MADITRPLRIRKRPGLKAKRLLFGVETSWVVKDPWSLKFVRLRPEDYAVWQMLDGVKSLADIQRRLERQFPEHQFLAEDLSRFVAQLHSQGLVVSDETGQGDALRERRDKNRSRELLRKWLNPMAIRFRGIDPQRVLDLVHARTAWMFNRWVVLTTVAFWLSAAALILSNFNAFLARLPSQQQFLTPSGLIILSVTLGVIKILHEFGHGVSCRHFGGDCHEMGIMFLVFTPCLYCNVSDAWLFPNKWHRIAVSAAGIYVELILASLAAYGWWFSSPGLFQSVCLSIMFVCSVNTVVFNGNPLLRYDGYYILADFVEAPNLAERAGGVVRYCLATLVGERPKYDDPLLPAHHWFWYAVYHLASSAYRWVVTLSILLFLMHLAKPYQMENIVRAVGVGIVASMIWPSLKRLHAWSSQRAGNSESTARRKSIVAGVVIGLLVLLFVVPAPKRIRGPIDVEPRDGRRVYVEVPGMLVEQTVRPGAVVRRGDVVARLVNDDLELQVNDLQAECERLRGSIRNYERERFADPAAALHLPELQRSLASALEQLERKQADRDRLTLKADGDGTVFPSLIPPPRDPPAGSLRQYAGRPIDRINLGCKLAPGTLYCEVGDPRRWQALVVVDHTDMPFVAHGQSVDIVFQELPDVVFRGTVDEVAQRELAEAPHHLSNKSGGDLPTETDAAGAEVPLATSYEARVALDDPDGLLRLGLRGSAKIHAAWEPLGRRALRWCASTFHFQL